MDVANDPMKVDERQREDWKGSRRRKKVEHAGIVCARVVVGGVKHLQEK